MVRLTKLEDELAVDTHGERRDACVAILRGVRAEPDGALPPGPATTMELDAARLAAIEVIERLWARYHARS
jgi:hypothetical protein